MKVKFLQCAILLGILLLTSITHALDAIKKTEKAEVALVEIAKQFIENDKKIKTIAGDIVDIVESVKSQRDATEKGLPLLLFDEIESLLSIFNISRNSLFLYAVYDDGLYKLLDQCQTSLCTGMIMHHRHFALRYVYASRSELNKRLDYIKVLPVTIENKSLLPQIDKIFNIIHETIEQIDKKLPQNPAYELERKK